MISPLILIPLTACLLQDFKDPPFVPLARKAEYKQSYNDKKIGRFIERGEVYFHSEIRDTDGQKFYLMETMGLSEATVDRIWPVLRSGELYDDFLPFVSYAEKLSPTKIPGRDLFEIKFGLWSFSSHLWVTVQDCRATGEDRMFEFVVHDGSFKGMEGRFAVRPWVTTAVGPKRFLVYMEAHWLQKTITMPKIILETGMEFALQRMGRAVLKKAKR